ncbi:MAG TPA: protein kinase [Terracidiphilus sp.]|jgi:serine/threonine-protein kinase|nr:protein kinase [Terracidiphilus sp.]
MDPLEVHQIGRYQLLDVIGKGGMGIVYRAIDTTIERKVAIKMLLGGREGGDADLLTRFYREVRFTANLQHKNIVTVYALDDLGGLPYMVMEYLEGQSISQLIASRQPIAIIEKLGLICQVCEGLQYAHDRNVIHRDVKPANILVLNDGVAKIVDFGIARVELSSAITRTGQIVGSMYYMSPEQTNGVADSRTDIYSTGVTLFEFLTGEVPFKGVDLSSTLRKIAEDPVPPLSKYLANYPSALDWILAKAMAKDVAERYQTAEDFAYDLSQLLDGLKREMTDEFIALAKQAMADRDLELARQKLQEILRLDRRNQAANELYREVREQIQFQQRSAQIEHLKAQADMALAGQQFEEALECIEQAKRLAPDDQTLVNLSESIRNQIERSRTLSEALRQGQAALYAGDLNEAGSAVRKALEIDNTNTEARALDTLVRKELEDRTRRAQLQGFLDEARRKIASKNFLAALQTLQQAQSIDPADSNIKELLTWAASGHEQEKLRNELRKYTDDIGQLIGEDQYEKAVGLAEAALGKFPGDVPLTKLYELARRQQDALKRRQIIDQASVKARALIDAGKEQDAIRILESALQDFPGDSNLEMLLEIARSQAEQNDQEMQDRERQVMQLAGAPPEERNKAAAEGISLLESSLTRRVPVPHLKELVAQVRELTQNVALPDNQAARLHAALAEFEARAAKRKHDLAEFAGFSQGIQNSTDSSEVESLAEQARSTYSQYPKDEAFRREFDRIKGLAGDFKARRDAVSNEISGLLRGMQSSKNLSELQKTESSALAIAAEWPRDEFIGNLLHQASAYVQEADRIKSAALKDLEELSQSVASARSRGQIKFLNDQVAMLASEVEDEEVSARANAVRQNAEQGLSRIDSAVLRFSELRAKASSADTLAEVTECESRATAFLEGGDQFEETQDLRQQMGRVLEERKKEYRRVSAGLEQLILNTKSAGNSELDAILGREQILLRRFPKETCFESLHSSLQSAVGERKRQLAEDLTFDQAAGLEEPDDLLLESSLDTGKAATAIGSRKAPSRFGLLISVPISLILCLGAALYEFPRTVHVTSEPNATVSVGDSSCRTPCSLRLKPGEYRLSAQESGYAESDQSLKVGWFESSTTYSISLVPAASTEASQVSAPQEHGSAGVQKTARIEVQTEVPGALVYVDNSASSVGQTDKNRNYLLPTTPGVHTLRIAKPGAGESDTQTVTVRADQVVVAFLPFRRESAKPAEVQNQPANSPQRNAVSDSRPATGGAVQTQVSTFLAIQAPLGAEVHIDQQIAGHSTGAVLKIQVQPGSHSVEVFLQGYQPFRKQVALEPGQEAELAAALQPIPVAPATPASAPNPSASGSLSANDRNQIQETLNRYATAVGQKDTKQLRVAWPDIPKNQLDSLRDFVRDHKGAAIALSVTRISLLEGGVDAVVTCKQTLQFDGKTSSADVTLYMKKLTTGWIITQIPRSN